MPPVVCKFWQQGTCRNGENCRFQHPPRGQSLANDNRFAPLQNSGNSSPRHNGGFQAQGGGGGGARPTQTLEFGLEKAAIITDLTSERPQWILSAYGPGRQAPEQLIGGPLREQSFEEIRLRHYIGIASGNPQQAAQEADQLYRDSEAQIQSVLRDVDGAINFIINAKAKHPNRLDTVNDSRGVVGGYVPNPINQGTNSGPFQMNQPASNPPIPQPSAPFGAPSAPFGTPSGGATSTAVPFGQPSAMGQRPNPFGATQFGAPSSLGQKPNPFASFAGKPAPFGAPSGQNPPPFGSANPPQFGQPSTQPPFGGASSAPFGAASGAPGNPFSTTTSQPPAGEGPFATSGAPVNPFSTATSQPPAGGAPFTTSGAPVNPFSTSISQPPPSGTPFAPSSAALQPTAPNPFASQVNPSTDNTFQPNGLAATRNPFAAAASTPVVNGGPASGSGNWEKHPDLASYATWTPDGRSLRTFKGKQVIYHKDDAGTQDRGRWERIWCPKGFPAQYADTQMNESCYDEGVEAAYKHLRQTGTFQGGIMPMVPPKQEWCRFDF